jgi:hypothetical protein
VFYLVTVVVLSFSREETIYSLTSRQATHKDTELRTKYQYGAEHYLRDQQLCSHSIVSQHYHGSRRFITAFTRAFHLSLSLARPIQSTSHNPSYTSRSILILSTHLRLDISSDLFLSSFRTNNLYAFLFPPIRATCSIHLIIFDLIILIILGEEYKSRSSSLYSFLYPSLSGYNILLSTLFSHTISLCSKLNVRDQVSYP